MNIQGTAALVTGGGSGLGEATARELARLGAKVAVLDLNMDNAERVAKDIGALRCTATFQTPTAWPRPSKPQRLRTAPPAS